MTPWFGQYQSAKKEVDLRDILRERNWDLRGDAVLAPWRDEREPSVRIYEDHWFDYGDETKHGDLLDWLELAEDMTKEEARAEASQILRIGAPDMAGSIGRTRKPTVRSERERDDSRQRVPDWMARFCNEARDALKQGKSASSKAAETYLRSRGLEPQQSYFGVVDETVELPSEFEPWYCKQILGRLLVIYEGQGNPVYYNARRSFDAESDQIKYLKPKDLTSTACFNQNALRRVNGGPLVLTEGELDAAAMLQVLGKHFPVIGLSGGKWYDGFLEQLGDPGQFREIVLIFDSDQAGQSLAAKRMEDLEAKGFKARFAPLPGYKDVNEALRELGPEAVSREVVHLLDSPCAVDVPSIGAVDSDHCDPNYLTNEFLLQLEARGSRPHPHYVTGLEPLDSLLGGGYTEGLHLLGGITGGGKTSFALRLALHNALSGSPVLYLTLEQSRFELWARLVASQTGTPYAVLKRGFGPGNGRGLARKQLLTSEGWTELCAASRYLRIVEGGDALSRQEGSATLGWLVEAAGEMTEAYGEPPLVIVDYLQRVPTPGNMRFSDVRDRVGFVAGQLQVALGRGIGCPVLALSSLNRRSYTVNVMSPEERLQAYKEAGELEYTCYTAQLLYRLPDKKRGEQMRPGRVASFEPMVIELVKNREGRTGRVVAKWHPSQDAWTDAVDFGGEMEKL